MVFACGFRKCTGRGLGESGRRGLRKAVVLIGQAQGSCLRPPLLARRPARPGASLLADSHRRNRCRLGQGPLACTPCGARRAARIHGQSHAKRLRKGPPPTREARVQKPFFGRRSERNDHFCLPQACFSELFLFWPLSFFADSHRRKQKFRKKVQKIQKKFRKAKVQKMPGVSPHPSRGRANRCKASQGPSMRRQNLPGHRLPVPPGLRARRRG